MNSTGAPLTTKNRSCWTWLVVTIVLAMVIGPLGTSNATAQDDADEEQTPDVMIPGTGQESDEGTPDAVEEEEPTTEPEDDEQAQEEEPESANSSEFAIDPVGVGSPAVIAHGLAYLSGGRVVWQVREVEPEEPGNAASETATTSILYQVEGSTIVRNDVTGKRTLLEPNEAFFLSGGDPYTVMSNSGDSLLWAFEIVDDVAVSDDAFYESPLIDDYAEGVVDLEMIRFVLQPGEVADIPEHTGPALVMSVQGDIDIESDGLGLLATGDGQLVFEPGTVANNSNDPVVYVVVGFGEEVIDAASSSASSGTTPEAVTDDEGDDTESTDTTTEEGTTTEDDTTTDDGETDAGTGSGDYRTSLNITALADLYVVVVVDGVTVFDGPIPSGGESGVIVGSVFQVYTTSGAMTQFTNACGDSFMMGFEEGEVTYTLEATADSCPAE
ncbi:MAG TPA: hypothetical protein VD767_11090 [Thermomicrobiales bacterium]|nr:hypothetical protein [Thermomicrobiales bacterium]